MISWFIEGQIAAKIKWMRPLEGLLIAECFAVVKGAVYSVIFIALYQVSFEIKMQKRLKQAIISGN